MTDDEIEFYKFKENPRKRRSHRERGPKKFFYTYEMLAELLGMSVTAVKSSIRHHKVVMESIGSVLNWCNMQLNKTK